MGLVLGGAPLVVAEDTAVSPAFETTTDHLVPMNQINEVAEIADLQQMGDPTADLLVPMDQINEVAEIADLELELMQEHDSHIPVPTSALTPIGAVLFGVVGAAMTAHRRHHTVATAQAAAMGAEMALTPACVVASI
jgi:hypothetical protein